MIQSIFEKKKQTPNPALHGIISREGCKNSAFRLLMYVLVTLSHPPLQVVIAAPPCNTVQGFKR